MNPRNGGTRIRCLTTWRHPNKETARKNKRLYGLSDKIRTCGLYHPKVARYQSAPHPDTGVRVFLTPVYNIIFNCKNQGEKQIFFDLFLFYHSAGLVLFFTICSHLKESREFKRNLEKKRDFFTPKHNNCGFLQFFAINL